ncbi:hypothetical protein NC653_026072 [Populus alba x Populus x berolinensis]|uniref:Uncharacterized protein n=1 Tax=Populus alba x Populus x berolinensis TaxID=444605 RepID=A0AAD6MDL3_9ROSI|nr:hypothetical protein NC653_026065 [Populus alba x Populus x berolinensis]KAJ6983142.1 hypothetical protein NC653_026072 [Populus alba x Populus x berolinensis]
MLRQQKIDAPWVLFHGLPSRLMITGELWTFYTSVIKMPLRRWLASSLSMRKGRCSF